MRKVIRLTESELIGLVKRVINEEEKNCPQNKRVTKNMIDSFLSKHKMELKSYIENNRRERAESLSIEAKKFLDIAYDCLMENFNLLYNIGLKSSYARFGFIPPYDQTSDVQKLVDNIVNKLLSTIESNFVYDNFLELYINKDNINRIAKLVEQAIDLFFDEISKFVNFSEHNLFWKIMNKMRELFPKFDYGCGINNLNPDSLTYYNPRKYSESKKPQIIKKLYQYV
jgi:hypothetical protein